MFLSESEKSSKSQVLKDLLSKLDEVDTEKFGSKSAPMVSEGDELGETMDEMSHDQVEAKEADLFPKEEAMEEKSEISPEDKANLEALAAKYLR